MHQTIYHAIAIDQETNYITEERPFYNTPGDSGKVNLALLAKQG